MKFQENSELLQSNAFIDSSGTGSNSGIKKTCSKTVILGVAESDAHVVANKLIEARLEASGYEVVNLGACTPLSEFGQAYENHPESVAILIGTLNGHALQDLSDLLWMKQKFSVNCPVIVGGKLGLSPGKAQRVGQTLLNRGVDALINDIEDVLSYIQQGQYGLAKTG